MIRLRRASALVTLFVLASAATAYAECAWVLWIEPDGQGGRWTRRSAWDSRRACVAEQAQSESAATQLIDALRKSGKATADDRPMRFSCWPDTVDPRGPKK
jgi:hypothetical protein